MHINAASTSQQQTNINHAIYISNTITVGFEDSVALANVVVCICVFVNHLVDNIQYKSALQWRQSHTCCPPPRVCLSVCLSVSLCAGLTHRRSHRHVQKATAICTARRRQLLRRVSPAQTDRQTNTGGGLAPLLPCVRA